MGQEEECKEEHHTWVVLHKVLASRRSARENAISASPISAESVINDDLVVVEVIRSGTSLIESKPCRKSITGLI